MKKKPGIYEKYIKRLLDFMLSFCALVVLSPVLIILTVVGAIKMKGNPFFTQLRPGKDEKIFKLVKFCSMTNEKDAEGNLLPDEQRLTNYGRFIRSTSLDELPELLNILKGDMSIVGPRPLAVRYLEFYDEMERKRHNVMPGLTGLAQINGRNDVNWPERFAYDLEYVNNISFKMDIMIVFKTIMKVLKRSNVSTRETGNVMDFDKFRIMEKERFANRIVMINDKSQIVLRSIKEDDAEFLMELNNDKEITHFVVGNPKIVTLDEQKEWMNRAKYEMNCKRFIVEYSKVPVGTIIVSNIDNTNLTASIGIKLHKTVRGKGIGKQSLNLAMQYCFEELDLECVYARVLTYNTASCALFRSCGFTNEGILRSRVIKVDKRCDLVSFSKLKEEQLYNQG